MRILALDPGLQTGWCAISVGNGTLEGGSFPLWERLTAKNQAQYEDIAGADVVVVERFLLYPWVAKRLKWDKLRVVEVIGVINYLAEELDVPVVMQNASEAKSIKLARKPEGFDEHACDALRHALAFLKKEGLLKEPFADLIA